MAGMAVMLVLLCTTAVITRLMAMSEETAPVALSGTVASIAAAYATYASLRYSRRLQDRAEGEHRRAEQLSSCFHAAVDGAPVGVVVLGLDARIQLVNARLRELLRVTDEGDLSIMSYFSPEDQVDVVATGEALRRGDVDRLVRDRQLIRADGSRLWCRISSSTLRDEAGEPAGIVAHIQDIEAERAAEEELRSKTRWFSAIVERSSDLITLFDGDGIITWVSPSVAQLLGLQPSDLLGLPIVPFIHRDDQEQVLAALQDVVAALPARAEYRVRGADGEWVWLESTATNLLEDPDVGAIIARSRDVTSRHRATELLAHRASHDALTDLANRAELEHQLETALEHDTMSPAPLAVAFLDLDGFKPINDRFGHGAGDDLLRTVAAVLRQQVRDGDLIARVGGDEFVVMLSGVDLTAAMVTAERIRARLSQPMAVEGFGEPVQVSASIGLAVAHPGDSVASLLRDADVALYEAKRRGRDRVEIAFRDHGGLTPRIDELIQLVLERR